MGTSRPSTSKRNSDTGSPRTRFPLRSVTTASTLTTRTSTDVPRKLGGCCSLGAASAGEASARTRTAKRKSLMSFLLLSVSTTWRTHQQGRCPVLSRTNNAWPSPGEDGRRAAGGRRQPSGPDQGLKPRCVSELVAYSLFTHGQSPATLYQSTPSAVTRSPP